jgi:hypothetical protein
MVVFVVVCHRELQRVKDLHLSYKLSVALLLSRHISTTANVRTRWVASLSCAPPPLLPCAPPPPPPPSLSSGVLHDVRIFGDAE